MGGEGSAEVCVQTEKKEKGKKKLLKTLSVPENFSIKGVRKRKKTSVDHNP